MICSRSYLESVAHPMIDRASFPVRFPIDNKYLSFDRRGFANVRVGSIYSTWSQPRIVNAPVLTVNESGAWELGTAVRCTLGTASFVLLLSQCPQTCDSLTRLCRTKPLFRSS